MRIRPEVPGGGVVALGGGGIDPLSLLEPLVERFLIVFRLERVAEEDLALAFDMRLG